MDKELFEIQDLLTKYVNKHKVREVEVEILKYYDKKKAVIKVM